MRQAARAVVVIATPCLSATVAHAQSKVNEWWPELDVYWTAPSRELRLFGLSSIARGLETDDRQLTLGLHVDYLPLSWGYVRVGYSWIRSLEHTALPEERALAEVHFPKTTGKLRFRNRTRVEFRWIGGEPSQRIRERVQVEREVMVSDKHQLVPYVTYELYWDSRYHAISRSAYRIGSQYVVSHPVTIDLSAVRQDNRFGSPRAVNALWLRLELSY